MGAATPAAEADHAAQHATSGPLAGVADAADSAPAPSTSVSRLKSQRPAPPLQVLSRGSPALNAMAAAGAPPSSSAPSGFPQGTPTQPPQASLPSLNSRAYTNPLTLFLFLLHLAAAAFAVGFFVYKAIYFAAARHEKRLLQLWLPHVEAAVGLSFLLGTAWQMAVRTWPGLMVSVIIWSSFLVTMAAGIMLLCFSMPATAGLGVLLILFSLGNGLYACWVTRRVPFTSKVFVAALHAASKFRSLNGPAYLMMGLATAWTAFWCLAVVGAAEFDFPALTILALTLSLAWTAEVMRNVTNLTVSRVVALYYLRGMQSSTQFSFQRAVTRNLGSACLGSLFVPTIEALRIIARALNLLEGEDEFLFSCAHCCLTVMEWIFHYGNGWAFVHIAAYGKGFVAASQSTWALFERQGMDQLVDSDISSSVCFLTGVTSGALCVILTGSWTFTVHRSYTATASLAAFFVGYLMTRIGMALPQACVACYYVCYAESPSSRLFDSTLPDRLQAASSGHDLVVPTPRFPHRIATA